MPNLRLKDVTPTPFIIIGIPDCGGVNQVTFSTPSLAFYLSRTNVQVLSLSVMFRSPAVRPDG